MYLYKLYIDTLWIILYSTLFIYDNMLSLWKADNIFYEKHKYMHYPSKGLGSEKHFFYKNNNCININNSKCFDIDQKKNNNLYTSNDPEFFLSRFPQKYLAAQMFST